MDFKLCKTEFAHNDATNCANDYNPFHVVYCFSPPGPLDSYHFQKLFLLMVVELQNIHKQTWENLKAGIANYKVSTDQSHIEF